jgi:regulator of sigma E protease
MSGGGGPGILLTVISFLLLIGPLIFVHELGHYLAGRLFGVKADTFSIGFGHELAGWTDKRGTRWKVGALPLGGYVKFAGDMNPASTPSAEWLALPAAERARTFQGRPLWQRFLIVLAGPATNFLFAILVFSALFAIFGEPRTPPIVAKVVVGSAAQAAGLQPGDEIETISGRAITYFEDIAPIVLIRPGERLDVVVKRHGRELTLAATPKPDVIHDRFGNTYTQGLLGIGSGAGVYVKLSPMEVPQAAVGKTVETVRLIVDTTWQIITGRRSTAELHGVLKIAQFSGETATLGWQSFVYLMALISVNLGFINLLPVPLLDGGHLLFYAIEGVRRRPLHSDVQDWAFRSGLALLLALMVFVTFNDLSSFGVWTTVARLIG